MKYDLSSYTVNEETLKAMKDTHNLWVELVIIATFKNGKERRIRVKNPNRSLDFDDAMHLVRVADDKTFGNPTFNRCLELSKFTSIKVYMHRKTDTNFYSYSTLLDTPKFIDRDYAEQLCKVANQCH